MSQPQEPATPQALDPINLPLSGTHLIEASAGTGKTYTITGLYLRLILEKNLAVENILVVTFTEASCQELRDGIRERLSLALDAFSRQAADDNHETDDSFISVLLTKYQEQGLDAGRLRDRLALALMDFDLAAVYTIHGFCQRVLRDSAFESAFPFNFELIESDSEFLQQVIDDFWRRHLGRWPPVFENYLCREGWTPDRLVEVLPPLLSKARAVGLQAFRWPEFLNPERLTEGGLELLDPAITMSLLQLWQDQWQSIMAALDSPALSKAVKAYSANNVQLWAAQLDDFCRAPKDRLFPLEAVEAFSTDALKENTKRSCQGLTPEHRFFEQCNGLLNALRKAFYEMLQDLLQECMTALPDLKLKKGLLSYDDLLSGVRDGLRKQGSGRQLAARVGRQYPVALIDEFQDTDSLQYDIFKRIYPPGKGTLFMVGDPKQAIYSFRGADIFSYLEAAGTGQSQTHTLSVNWRSEPGLVAAVNYLFGRHRQAFVLPKINFRPADSPVQLTDRLVVEQPDDAPLSIISFPDQENRETAKKRLAVWTATRIRTMLALAGDGKCHLHKGKGDSLPLTAGGIAVLVRSHHEGELMRQALNDAGLAAIIQSRQTVYETAESRDLELVLTAICRSGQEKALRAALSTRLLGATVGDLLDFEQQEELWDAWLNRLNDYKRIWQERGPAPMLYDLLQREGVYGRLSTQKGAERLLTNLRHLIELLQAASHNERLGPEELLAWFAKRRHDEKQAEDWQIRLESDENLIKIVTVHKSKGLQYPVVFCPFFWDSQFLRTRREIYAICHEDSRLVVDMTSGNDVSRQAEERERLSEELRLLYVAMTRAKHRCYLFWGRVRSGRSSWATATSALHYLLRADHFAGNDLLTALKEDFANINATFLEDLHLSRESGGRIAVVPTQVPDLGVIGGEMLRELAPVRVFEREFNRYLGVTSFSALHQGVGEVEEPDYDREEGAETVTASIIAAASADLNHDGILALPRGTQAGSCLHAILEELDFQDDTKWRQLAEEKLAIFGIEQVWTDTVLRLLRNIMHTGLNEDGSLTMSRISADDRLTELEFYYPVPASNARELTALFNKRPASDNVRLPEKHGFMKGFIDLVFRWRGRFYIVDYKSNYLGGSLDDYKQDRLPAAMRQAGYDLQYAIYTEALHRYLGQRLPDYDYERNFGGIYYLFLRGLRPDKGASSGVFFDRP